MTEPFDTSLLDTALAVHRERCEEERQTMLRQLLELLQEAAGRFDLREAYISGSVVTHE